MIPPATVSKLGQLRSHHFAYEETVKAVGPFFLVFMPREVKDPTHGQICNLSWTQRVVIYISDQLILARERCLAGSRHVHSRTHMLPQQYGKEVFFKSYLPPEIKWSIPNLTGIHRGLHAQIRQMIVDRTQ